MDLPVKLGDAQEFLTPVPPPLAERVPEDERLVLAADHGHFSTLRRMAPSRADKDKVHMLRAFDPAGTAYARQLLPASVEYAANALDAAEGADALVLLTEWNEFRALAPARLRAAMRGDVLLDFRNVYDPEAVRAAGFRYHSIGRP